MGPAIRATLHNHMGQVIKTTLHHHMDQVIRATLGVKGQPLYVERLVKVQGRVKVNQNHPLLTDV